MHPCHRLIPGLLATVPAAALSLQAQPDNDAFAGRQRVDGTPTLRLPGTTLAATREPGEQAPTGAGAGEVSVWWSWLGPVDGLDIVI